jgi:signal transduction histidine kinase
MNFLTTMRASWGQWMSQTTRLGGPWWPHYLWTSVFAVIIAACFTVAGFLMLGHLDPSAWRSWSGWGYQYLNYLVFSLLISFLIQGLFMLAGKWLGEARVRRMAGWRRWLFFAGIPVVGVVAGNLLAGLLLGDRVQVWARSDEPNAVLGSVLFAGLTWFLFAVYFSARTQKIRAERRAAEAQLRLLQAQMEPHFLFNTLANVVGLMEIDTPRAKAMLESFTDYLRASLGSLRAPEHSLADELALVEAYLRVVKVRMEERLHYRIDVPAALLTLRLPALSLQPLVENAVVHGLEPSIVGGHVVIAATLEGGALVIRVRDDGLGLDAPRAAGHRGSGTALNNIRERLRQTHAELAGLRIDAVLPHGVCATLTLPSGALA